MAGVVTEVYTALDRAHSWWGNMRRVPRSWCDDPRVTQNDLFVAQCGSRMLNPSHLETCSLLWVSPDMVDLVAHASETLPPYDFDASRLPWPRGFCVLAKPVEHDDVRVSAVAWTDDLERVTPTAATHAVLMLVRSQSILAPVVATTMRSGAPIIGLPRRLEGELPEHDWDAHSRFLCTLWLMVQQKVAVVRTTRGDRADQKRWGRKHDDELPYVTLVELRRPTQTTPHEDTPVGFVDWSHRWIVDGHWRNQFHPSTGEHVPTWIAPHVKGPGDKPLIVKRKVNAWVR